MRSAPIASSSAPSPPTFRRCWRWRGCGRAGLSGTQGGGEAAGGRNLGGDRVNIVKTSSLRGSEATKQSRLGDAAHVCFVSTLYGDDRRIATSVLNRTIIDAELRDERRARDLERIQTKALMASVWIASSLRSLAMTL